MPFIVPVLLPFAQSKSSIVVKSGTVDEIETLLTVTHFNQTSFSITWTASGRKNFVRFSPSGNAREFGRFNLCNKKDKSLAAQTLVVSRMGKLRRYRDRDQDGSVEDRDGRKPDC